jgi:FAD/FMN-containing dehydrogenase
MNNKTLSRRLVLKQLVSMSVLGALGPLRSLPLAAEVDRSVGKSIHGIQGKIIRRQDENYELWRQSMVWHQSKPNRYPDMIIQAQSDQDVIAAVKYAAENKLKVAIRSGGHNSNGPSLRNGGVLIDVSAMSDIKIDESTQIASIQPGVRSLQLVTEAREKGLSFPVPHCPSVGLSGFVMGGGIGWNYPQRGGMATFSIVGAKIVTADGKLVIASADQNPDLFWAVRGAGPGFFGVVTRLQLKLYPVPKAIMASSYIFPLDDLETVTTALDNIRKNNYVERVELITLLMHHPEVPADAPPEESKICFVTAFAFEDSEDGAKAVLEPFAQSALATKSMVKIENQVFSFESLYERYFSLEDSAGRMARYAVDNVLTNDGSKTLHALADHFRRAPSKDCHVLAAYGMNLEKKNDSCFSTVADCFVGCYSIWDGEENDDRNFRWLAQTLPLMDPFAEGHYVNEVEGRKGRGHPDRFRQCFSDANWKRLQQLRQKYDPNGVFHSYLGHT